MKLMKEAIAIRLGFSADKRKRRNQHRRMAKKMLHKGGFFNCYSARGSTLGEVASWHLNQARML